MRIIAGRHRGIRLASLGAGDAAAHLRPTSDRVRESLFNMLAHGGYSDPPLPQGARVLDLFAGTGALGLEALSRGADHVCFADNGRKALGLLEQNITRLKAESETRVLAQDATRLERNRGAGFDLIFLDPPYGKGLGERAIAAAMAGGWFAPDAVIVWEESAELVPPPGLTLLDERRYGDTMIAIFRHDAPVDDAL